MNNLNMKINSYFHNRLQKRHTPSLALKSQRVLNEIFFLSIFRSHAMTEKRVHMRDQVTNRVAIIMEEDHPGILQRIEEYAVMFIFMLIFVALMRV
ncbi:MAG: hypothetical protein ABL919_01220 [Methylococcales bacterium]|nr:hypothetical protein [Methylococcaceae bacterium]